MSEYSIFSAELTAVLQSELALPEDYQEHTFSPRFERIMARLVKAFPSRGLIFTVQHRGRAYAAAAAVALALLTPLLYLNISPALTHEESSEPDDTYKTSSGYYVAADYDIYGIYQEYAVNYHTKKPSPLGYNFTPDLTGKLHPAPSDSDMTARPLHISDGRYYSDGIIIVHLSGSGEVRQNELGLNVLHTDAEVIYSITDKNSELNKKTKIDLAVTLSGLPESTRFEEGRQLLVMVTKREDGVYSPVNGFDSCFYINDSDVQCDDLDMTVTSLTDNPACTKYDGLPLYAAVYDMMHGEDIFNKDKDGK